MQIQMLFGRVPANPATRSEIGLSGCRTNMRPRDATTLERFISSTSPRPRSSPLAVGHQGALPLTRKAMIETVSASGDTCSRPKVVEAGERAGSPVLTCT